MVEKIKARRVVMANAHILLDDSIKDCGTKRYFKMTVDKNLAKIIKDRYMVVNGRPKLIEDPQALIGQTIQLRSPLYCKSEKGICPICYGDSWKLLKNKNIGVLAGGDVNNKALNAYMCLFHVSKINNKFNFKLYRRKNKNLKIPTFVGITPICWRRNTLR